MYRILRVLAFAFLSLIGSTAAVDTANGERVGGCPSSIEVPDMVGQGTMCRKDSDCTNPVQKCCIEKNTGIAVCVDPIPACRDGMKIRTEDMLPGTCAEFAHSYCADRGCEDGPGGAGGWGGTCCGGYAFEWISGVPRPTCVNGVNPLKDSEGEYFWCGNNSVRSCPQNSSCITDTGGYKICCPSSSSAPVCAPGEQYTLPDNPCMDCRCGYDGLPSNDCAERMCDVTQCPAGTWAKHIPGTCCGMECVDSDCSQVACVQGFPVCDEGSKLHKSYPPGACCPKYECIKNDNLWMTDGKLSYVGIIVIVVGSIIIISSVIGMVTCYLLRQKHRDGKVTKGSPFNNLGYTTTGEKKKIENNYTNLVKEKEALQKV